MSLKNLIKNQTIIIDDHKRGTGEIKNFDNPENDVHIDKETNFLVDGKRQKVKIRIPINSDNPIKIESKRQRIPIPRILDKEIRSAFENQKIRDAFISDVLKTLENYETALNSEEQAIVILKRLSKHFDLKWDIRTIKEYSENALSLYTQFYKDDQNKKFFIKLEEDKITIGENNGYAKAQKKYNT
ncbi:hypothetical protein [Flavobacterium sp. DG2-3]|uniref:hypothetical protein n=1 Tax=Flavobacterium sp. DG2-3 TaxID=3068317 RepID=UPI00273F8B51|nr:hypothetical protein [Flavobacterium sp. DG2-3]MDP5201388.1 hypothetical protein [Flavobacterium sp. DG2-3]